MARATVTVDLGFGDAGKGSIVDFLARADGVSAVVRYSGGPQAGHRVVDAERGEHVFAQFGSGTFVPGVRTHLAAGMLVNPLNLMVEDMGLRKRGVRDAMERLSVDPDCLIVTPFHVAANRLRELLREDRHGSCGMGIGEARGDALHGKTSVYARHIPDASLYGKLAAIQEDKLEEMKLLIGDRWDRWIGAEMRVLADKDACRKIAAAYQVLRPRLASTWHLAELLDDGHLVFEAAQGVLLDEFCGLEPYRTWTDTTSGPALKLLAELGVAGDDVRVIGITRAYSTRHGAGPFPTEDAGLTEELPDARNVKGAWQGEFRVGWLDLPLMRYALAADGAVGELAVTCLDRAREPWMVATDVESDEAGSIWHGPRTLRGVGSSAELVELIEEETGIPVTITSRGPMAADKVEVVRVSA